MADVEFQIKAVAVGIDQIEAIKQKLLATEEANEKLAKSFVDAGLSEKQAQKAVAMHAVEQKALAASQDKAAKEAENQAKKQATTESVAADKTSGAMSVVASATMALAAAAVTVGAAITAVFVKIGSVAFEAAKFKSETMQALRYVESSAKAASDTYRTIGQYANLAGTQKKAMADAMIAVRQGGFDRRASEDILAAVSDITARGGQGDAFAKAISQLKVKERLDSGLLSQLAGSINDPFFEKEFLKMIGQSRGLSVKNAAQIESVKGLLDSGQIKETEGLNAILTLVSKRVSQGGKLGSVAIAQAENNVDSQLTRLKENFSSLLENVNIQPIIKAISNIADAFNPATESGAKFAKTFEDLFAKGGNLIEEYLTPENIEKAFKTITDVMSGLKTGFLAFVDAAKPGLDALAKSLGGGKEGASNTESAMRALGETLGMVVNVAARIAAAFAWVSDKIGFLNIALLALSPVLFIVKMAFEAVDKIAKFFADNTKGVLDWITNKIQWVVEKISGAMDKVNGLMQKTGISAIAGFASGFASKVSEAVTGAKEAAKGVVNAVKDELEIRSPSRVFAKIGVQSAQGFSEGFEDESDSPNLSALTKTSAPKGKFGASNTFNISVTMGNENDLTNLESEIRRIFERVALEILA